MTLHGKDTKPHMPENRGLVAAAGADLQHAHSALRLQKLRHDRHRIGLGDRLAAVDRKRVVLVRTMPEREGNELLPGNTEDGAQHQLVVDTGCSKYLDKVFARA